jgi:hypothetical protein
VLLGERLFNKTHPVCKTKSQRVGKLFPVIHIQNVLLNPGIGFTTFQRFNGDSQNVLEDCCGDFKKDFPFKGITAN